MPSSSRSALVCVTAGKPFLYDGFNSTRLIELGKLNQQPMLDALHQQRIAAVEFDGPLDEDVRQDRFTPGMLAAIQQEYVPAFHDQDATILLPRNAAPRLKP